MRKLLAVLVFTVCINSLHAFGNADTVGFFWSLGDIGVSFAGNKNNFEFSPFMNVGNINWITKHGFGWAFHVFNIEGGSDWNRALILPVEISYSPFGDNSKRLFLTLYGRGGWMLNYGDDVNGTLWGRNGVFGAAGFRAAWIPKPGEYWSVFTGAFVEYTSENEIRMGVSIDTAVVIALGVLAVGIMLRDEEEE